MIIIASEVRVINRFMRTKQDPSLIVEPTIFTPDVRDKRCNSWSHQCWRVAQNSVVGWAAEHFQTKCKREIASGLEFAMRMRRDKKCSPSAGTLGRLPAKLGLWPRRLRPPIRRSIWYIQTMSYYRILVSCSGPPPLYWAAHFQRPAMPLWPRILVGPIRVAAERLHWPIHSA